MLSLRRKVVFIVRPMLFSSSSFLSFSHRHRMSEMVWVADQKEVFVSDRGRNPSMGSSLCHFSSLRISLSLAVCEKGPCIPAEQVSASGRPCVDPAFTSETAGLGSPLLAAPWARVITCLTGQA